MVIARKFPKISIDREKCTVPFLCKKCLQICPTVVLHLGGGFGKVRQERLKEVDPRLDGAYTVSASRVDVCTMCNKCIDVCPVDAIKVEMG